MKKPHPDDSKCCNISDGIKFRNDFMYSIALEEYITYLEEKINTNERN